MVDWDPVANADRYHVYVGADLATMELKESATASEKEVGGLTPGTKYFFYVTSINTAGGITTQQLHNKNDAVILNKVTGK